MHYSDYDRRLSKHLGTKLYQARIELSLTQTDLEKEGIISQSLLSKYENAELSISAVLLYKLAQRYNKDLQFFYDEFNQKSK